MFALLFLCVWFLGVWKLKKEEGSEREDMLERHKEKSVFAGLCNCADLIGGEGKRFLYLVPQCWERGRGRGKGGMVDGKERQCWLRLSKTAREWKRVKQHALLAVCLRVYSVQGVQRSTVIKRPQKTAMRKREGAIKERKERALNYWTAYLAVYAAICTMGPEPI